MKAFAVALRRMSWYVLLRISTLVLLFEAWTVSKTLAEALAEARRNSWSVSSRSKPNQFLETTISGIDMEVFQAVVTLCDFRVIEIGVVHGCIHSV